ncbi:hypothetical protein EV191_108124 [Tamaricihabitans halophyticus]|uniref:VOC domain-containing protein n=1 Tax=Tamaricihabitans halophyticus TaxID=1262583 RepID=A0A4R2QL17_9PSEU|nr:VOC family protein [Tamaricihabitans halophyticus]TCP50037.1 hypothetical protein EV191_108124 [Tamaricihabitans halophyticus]
MPIRESAPQGAPCWIDLMTADPQRSADFYGSLFGWTAEPPNEEFGGYFNFRKDGIRIAGCMRSQEADHPDVWSVYLAVPDAAKAAETAGTNGGQVVVPAMPVGDFGAMTVVTDPGGATIGGWQPQEHQGFGIITEPGAPAWFELHTRDYQSALEFYRTVFGWRTHTVSDTPDFRYTVLDDNGNWLAGVMAAEAVLPEGVPAHWSVYFGTEDTDAALTRIVELGGTVVDVAMDTPYGRLATAADPTGARFKLNGPNVGTG